MSLNHIDHFAISLPDGLIVSFALSGPAQSNNIRTGADDVCLLDPFVFQESWCVVDTGLKSDAAWLNTINPFAGAWGTGALRNCREARLPVMQRDLEKHRSEIIYHASPTRKCLTPRLALSVRDPRRDASSH